MNTSYDMTESPILIDKLIRLTRDSKIEWTHQDSSARRETLDVYRTPLAGDVEAVIWVSGRQAGFRLSEKKVESNAFSKLPAARILGGGDRDILSIMVDHEEGPTLGETYINLMALLELARRSVDKVEPKIDRVKQYLDQLAV